MIATHTPKMLNARLKQKGLVADMLTAPLNAICSSTTIVRKKYWACPTNAADIKYWRKVIEDLADSEVPLDIPDLTEPHLKQILLPTPGLAGDYVSATPVSSVGLAHELHQRLKEQGLPFKSWVIQPTPAAMANHGEALLVQSGKMRLLRRGVAKLEQGNWQGDFVQMTARCEKMNVSSGLLAVGFPAITAIGGFVHTIERKLGYEVEFAFGLASADWIAGVPRVAYHSNNHGSFNGRVKGGKVEVKPGYITDEITSNCNIVLLLRAKHSHQLNSILEFIQNTHRLAGGQLFDIKADKVLKGKPIKASYLIDASKDVARLRNAHGVDNLQAALMMYGLGGEWRGREWYQPRNGYTLNHTGYGFLESPTNKKGARSNYPHGWAEPTHSLVTQGSMSEAGWWHRSDTSNGVFWEGSN